MALAFPLSLAQFADLLPVAQIRARPTRADMLSETSGGEVMTHRIGTRLWSGEITLGLAERAVYSRIEPLLTLLEEPGASFLWSDPRYPAPQADPGGAALDGYSPTIHALEANNRELRLAGLPEGYVISPGDPLGWSYGANPLRRALHRVVTGGTADAQGHTPLIEVTPFLRPGTSTGLPVSLIRPVCKAVLVDADYGFGRSVLSEGAQLRWQQTLR